MGWISAIAIYVVIWWLVIFMVLPWGNTPIGREDIAKGHAPSAPARPRLLLKMAVTSLVAAIVWLVVYWALTSGAVSFRE